MSLNRIEILSSNLYFNLRALFDYTERSNRRLETDHAALVTDKPKEEQRVRKGTNMKEEGEGQIYTYSKYTLDNYICFNHPEYRGGNLQS